MARLAPSGTFRQQLGLQPREVSIPIQQTQQVQPPQLTPQQIEQQIEQQKQQVEIQKQNAKTQQEISEWDQAEKLAFRISSGIGQRYDSQSAVGIKINRILNASQVPEVFVSHQRSQLQQQQQTYTDPTTGFGYSIAPTTKPIITDFIKPQLKQSIAPPRDIRQEGKIDIAPSQLDYFKEQVSQKGIVTGTLGYLGGLTSSLSSRGQDVSVKKFGGQYDPQVAELTGGVVRISPYFTPAGSTILVGEGVESILSKKGKEDIKISKERLREAGLPEPLAYAPSAAMIGLGVFGVTGQLRGLRSASEAKQLGELSKSDVRFKGYSVIDESGGLVKVKGEQQFGRLTTEFDVSGKLIREGERTVFMPTGEGVATTFGKFKPTSGSRNILSTQAFKVGGKTYDVGAMGDYFRTISKTTVVPESRVGLIYSGEIGKLSQDKEWFGQRLGKGLEIGGEPTTSYSAQVSRKISKSGKTEYFAQASGELGVGDSQLQQVSKEFGFIKRQNVQDLGLSGFEKDGTNWIKKVSGGLPKWKKTPASKTFEFDAQSILKQADKTIVKIPSQQAPSMDFGVISKATGKGLQRTVKSQPTSLWSQFAGLGMYERTMSDVKFNQNFLRPSIKQGQGLMQQLSSSTKQSSLQIMKTSQITKPASIAKTLQDLSTATRTQQESKTLQISKTFQMLKSSLSFDKVGDIFRVTRPPIPKTSTKKPAKKPIPFLVPLVFPSFGSPKKKKKKGVGYIPQAKTKGGKWMALSKDPMNRTSALSRGSRAVDKTLSAQFRIKKAKGKVSQIRDNYFGATSYKYRPYKIRKGQKIDLINHYIEKRGSRLDTPGELSGIKLARFAKQRGWLTKPKRRKKSGKTKKRSN